MKTVSFKGKQFQINQGETHPAYSYFTFEEEENDFRNQYWNIQEGQMVFDVGSSYGAYALTACVMGATVYCFEPERSVYTDLVKNINLNDWQDRCFPSNLALWDKEEMIYMKDYAPHWPPQTISGGYLGLPLDTLVKECNIERLDWLKIDVEGAELNVLNGARETIKKFAPNIIVECHVFLNSELKDRVKEYLLSLVNYELEEVNRDPCIMVIGKKL